MRDLEELLGRVAHLEASLSAIELSLTRLRFAMERIPADGGGAHVNLMETLHGYEHSITVLRRLHQDALWDLETMKNRQSPS